MLNNFDVNNKQWHEQEYRTQQSRNKLFRNMLLTLLTWRFSMLVCRVHSSDGILVWISIHPCSLLAFLRPIRWFSYVNFCAEDSLPDCCEPILTIEIRPLSWVFLILASTSFYRLISPKRFVVVILSLVMRLTRWNTVVWILVNNPCQCIHFASCRPSTMDWINPLDTILHDELSSLLMIIFRHNLVICDRIEIRWQIQSFVSVNLESNLNWALVNALRGCEWLVAYCEWDHMDMSRIHGNAIPCDDALGAHHALHDGNADSVNTSVRV